MPRTSGKTQRNTSVKRQKAPARRSVKKKRKQSSRSFSTLYKYLIAVIIVCVFSGLFYFFVIRPSSYKWKDCPGLEHYGVCVPCCYDIHGIDISHYQGNINWKELERSRTERFPLHFIFMKATEGEGLDDKTFAGNFELARKHGFIRGAYHFYSPKASASRQADFFIRNVRLKQGDLPPVLDIEVKGKRSKRELQDSLKVWLRKVEKHYSVKPILYTSYKFKMDYLNDPFFNSYPYWIAHYYVDSVRYEGKWHFWQHTDAGTVPGIRENVDLNVFNGTLEELLGLTIR